MTTRLPSDVTYFASAEVLRDWLAKNGTESRELWIGFHKKASGRPSVTYREALDEALCFGWIDGVRYKVDDDAFTQRFTPRKGKSYWSEVNTRRAHELTAQGRMTPVGLAAFEQRDEAKTERYALERAAAALTPEEEQRFRTNEAAWAWFEKQAPSYRRLTVSWVSDAKQDETRRRRLDALIEDSAAGRPIRPLRRPSER